MWPMRSRTPKKSSTGANSSSRSPNCAAFQHVGLENDTAVLRWKDKALADGHLATGSHECVPAVFARWFGQHDFDAASGLFFFATQRSPRVEPGWNHPAVIQHQQVAGAEEGREVVELAVA